MGKFPAAEVVFIVTAELRIFNQASSLRPAQSCKNHITNEFLGGCAIGVSVWYFNRVLLSCFTQTAESGSQKTYGIVGARPLAPFTNID